MSKPFFSIVIPSYNYGRFLGDALESVLRQSEDDCEVIVVDGGSTDNTLDVIRNYEANIAWWCSEKDRGQSDAFNKGFARAQGTFFTWLNADDLLLPNTLRIAKRCLQKRPACRWLTGNTIYVNESLTIQRCAAGPPWLGVIGWRTPPVIYGPTSFFHRSLFASSRGFDVEFRYGMDSDLWHQFRDMGAGFQRLNHYCWAFRIHDSSMTSHAFHAPPKPAFQRERNLIRERYRKPSRLCSAALLGLKMITGYPRSVLDTLRWRGASIQNYTRAVAGP
jgi:glycosyltransferase involved in cell wall biosynthesis